MYRHSYREGDRECDQDEAGIGDEDGDEDGKTA